MDGAACTPQAGTPRTQLSVGHMDSEKGQRAVFLVSMSQWDSYRGLPQWEAGRDASGWRQKARGRRARERVAHTGSTGILRTPLPRSLQELAWATQEKTGTAHSKTPATKPALITSQRKQREP